MLAAPQRPFGSDIHTLNVGLVNQPGTLARVLVTLQHHGVNIEDIRVTTSDDRHRSIGTLAIKAPVDRLGLIQRKIEKLVGVLEAHTVASCISE